MSKQLPAINWKFWRIDAAGIVVCAGFTALVYFAGLEPLWERYNEFTQQQTDVELKRQHTTLSAASLASMHRKLGVLQQELTDTPAKLKPAGMINNRIAELTDLASRSSIKIEDIAPGQPAHAKRFDVVPIKVAGNGTYRTCAQFIHNLRKTFPDTGVASFSLSGNPSDPTEPAKFQFDLEWFAAPSPAPTAPTASIK
jgi:Tfp pilus assembly protein PilO